MSTIQEFASTAVERCKERLKKLASKNDCDVEDLELLESEHNYTSKFKKDRGL